MSDCKGGRHSGPNIVGYGDPLPWNPMHCGALLVYDWLGRDVGPGVRCRVCEFSQGMDEFCEQQIRDRQS